MSNVFAMLRMASRSVVGTPLITAPTRAAPRQRAMATKAAVSKKDLVQVVATKAGISTKQAESAVNGFLEAIVNTVAKGEKVELKGFGSFQPRRMAAREGRNPSTGEPLHIPESVTGSFTIGKTFKDTVKGAHAPPQ